MKQALIIFQIVCGILLTVSILVQAKGTGLGSAWGGAGEFYRSKRGVEKFLFIFTIVLSCLFILSGLVSVALR